MAISLGILTQHFQTNPHGGFQVMGRFPNFHPSILAVLLASFFPSSLGLLLPVLLSFLLSLWRCLDTGIHIFQDSIKTRQRARQTVGGWQKGRISPGFTFGHTKGFNVNMSKCDLPWSQKSSIFWFFRFPPWAFSSRQVWHLGGFPMMSKIRFFLFFTFQVMDDHDLGLKRSLGNPPWKKNPPQLWNY